MVSSAVRKCPQCGTLLHGASAVEGLCSVCLLSLGLRPDEEATEATPLAGKAGAVGARVGTPRTLSPVDTGVVATAWAMPAELLRQAARRLRLAAVGLGPACAVGIVLN